MEVSDQKKHNMWDGESRSYSLMTLMEVDGTNKQLDAIPLDRDDIVLDCGCGPGRVAIQAAKRVKKVICLDNSEGMLKECKKNCEAAGITNVEFVLADWQETNIGVDIPEVDVVIQSRGGGGPSTYELLKKAARKYAVNIMWTPGAPNLPESRNKLFVNCYSEEVMEQYPRLRPFDRSRFPKKEEVPADPQKGALPMGPGKLFRFLKDQGMEVHTTTVPEGWNRHFASKEEAYSWLIQLSDYPDLVDQEQFKRNVDQYLTPDADGYEFFLPTSSDVTYFKTRENRPG